METLERCNMPTTIKNIKGTELPPSLRSRFNVKDYQYLTLTVEIEEEYDVENVGEALIEAFQEIKAHKEGKLKLNNAREFLSSL